jgi:hypothetical protein
MTVQEKVNKLREYISYWESQPENKWCKGTLYQDGNYCAQGHIYSKMGWFDNGHWNIHHPHFSAECDQVLSTDDWAVVRANNDSHPNYQQPTPKQRTLAWAYDKLEELKAQLPKQPKVLANLPKVKEGDTRGTEKDVENFERIAHERI